MLQRPDIDGEWTASCQEMRQANGFVTESRMNAQQSGRVLLKEVVKRIEGETPSVDLPLDVQATAFQRRVWQELQKIPRGSTRTYTQVARAIGRPTAVRAVARACATNPVSIVVPCHRVVREDGNLAGYRWGLSRKQALIEHEAKTPAARRARA